MSKLCLFRVLKFEDLVHVREETLTFGLLVEQKKQFENTTLWKLYCTFFTADYTNSFRPQYLLLYMYFYILVLSLLRDIGRPTSAHSFNTTAAFHSWHLHHHVWCVTVRLPTFLFPHTEKMDFMVMLSWSPATCWCLYLPVHLVDKVMVKRVQERIHKWSGVSCLKEYAEGAWRCEAEMECKILFPRINLFPGSAKWLGILSCTLPRHGQCVSVCAGSGNTWVC